MNIQRSLVRVALATMACALACGGTSDPSFGELDAGTVTDGSMVSPDAGTTEDASVLADAGLQDQSAPDAALDTRIDPITVGHSWTYDVVVNGTYPMCSSGSQTGKVKSKHTLAGKDAYTTQSFCAGFGDIEYAIDGDKVEQYYLGAWTTLLDTPVQAGHTWKAFGFTWTWVDAGTVTVPAGTFTKCFTRKQSPGNYNVTFCRGAGPVIWQYDDGFGNGYEAKLTAKNF